MIPLDQKTIDRYRKLQKLASHSGGDTNEKLQAQKRLLKLEQKYPHILDLAGLADKKEEIEDGFIRPPVPPPDASWLTQKLSDITGWAVDKLQEAQLEVLMNEAMKQQPMLGLDDQLDEGVDLEVSEFDADDGEKCVEIVIVLPLGLWYKIASHKPFASTFVSWVSSFINDDKKDG
jgi:hypothetical protein|tara:strand:- start:5628 stop:6155 length:528 start_codon:yes stop_codon:yes gene_type:complete